MDMPVDGARKYKVVLPVAGLGTRLLPATKEQPKEMLPIFAPDGRGGRCLKPLLQLVFEQLYNYGFREFIFVVGRGKRAVEDHFTPDAQFVEELERRGKTEYSRIVGDFYRMLSDSVLTWVNQPSPLGFGHAVLITRHVVGSGPLIVQAGDTYIHSDGNRHISRVIEVFESRNADAVILLKRVADPRIYGVVEGKSIGERIVEITGVEEKPERPRSNLAIMPLYVFKGLIFKALETVKPDSRGEIQLTDGIQRCIEWGGRVYGVEIGEGYVMDIGNPASYWEALQTSYALASMNK
ncbi:MAG: sugar phosphate nucleotidyltransferase [Nitrososphaerota archaeon]